MNKQTSKVAMPMVFDLRWKTRITGAGFSFGESPSSSTSNLNPWVSYDCTTVSMRTSNSIDVFSVRSSASISARAARSTQSIDRRRPTKMPSTNAAKTIAASISPKIWITASFCEHQEYSYVLTFGAARLKIARNRIRASSQFGLTGCVVRWVKQRI